MPVPRCGFNRVRDIGIHVREGKGGIAREIALSPTLLERLRVYFRWRRPTDWLFPSKQRHNEPLDDGSIRHLCRNATLNAPRQVWRLCCNLELLEAGGLRTLAGSPDGWPIPTDLGLAVAAVGWFLAYFCVIRVSGTLAKRRRSRDASSDMMRSKRS
jgi:hypothetical protein